MVEGMKSKYIFFVYSVFICAVYLPMIASECGTLIKKINASNTDELASFIYIDKKTDTEYLYFLSVNEAGSGNNSNKHSDLYYSTRRVLKSTENYNNIWNYPSFVKWCKNDEGQMRNLNLGPISIWGNDIIFAMESEANNGGYENSHYGNPNFDLYIAQYNSGSFGCKMPLAAINMDGYWDSHPAFSPDGSILYFSSDRPGGKGGADIYYSRRNNDGSWSVPVNLADINTPGNEVSPHSGSDGLFYFSTDWDYDKKQLSKAGKNIMTAKFATEGVPFQPKNLDLYIKENSLCPSSCNKFNTEFDDMFPFVSADKSYIYISSADRNGKYDIRVFSLYKPGITLKCRFKDIITDMEGNYISQNFKNSSAFFRITDVYGKTTAYSANDFVLLEPDARYKVEPDYSIDKCKTGEILGQKVFIVNTSKPSGCDTIIEREFTYKGKFISNKFIIKPQCFISGYWKPMNTENHKEFRGRASEGFFKDIPIIDSDFDDNVAAYKNDEDLSKIYSSVDQIIRDNYDCLNFEGIKMKITLNAFAFAGGIQNLPYHDEDVNTKKFDIAKGTRFSDAQKGNLTLSRLRAFYTFKSMHNSMLVRSNFYKSLYSKGRIIYELEGFGVSQSAIGGDGSNSLDINKVDVFVDFAPSAWIDNSYRQENGKISFIQDLTASKDDDYFKTRKLGPDEEIITSSTEIPVIDKDLLKDVKKEQLKTYKDVTKKTDVKKQQTKITSKKPDEKLKKNRVIADISTKDSTKKTINKKPETVKYIKPEISVKPKEKKVTLKQKVKKPVVKDTTAKITLNDKQVKKAEKPKESSSKVIAESMKKPAEAPLDKQEKQIKKKVPIEKKKVVVSTEKQTDVIINKVKYSQGYKLKEFESIITEYQKTDKFTVNCGAYTKESNCANLVGFLKRSGIEDVRIVPITRNKRTYYRVRIGLFDTVADAKTKAAEVSTLIRSARIGAPVVVVQD